MHQKIKFFLPCLYTKNILQNFAVTTYTRTGTKITGKRLVIKCTVIQIGERQQPFFFIGY